MHDLLSGAPSLGRRAQLCPARSATGAGAYLRAAAQGAHRTRLRLLPVIRPARAMNKQVKPSANEAKRQDATAAQADDDALWYKDAVIYQLHVKSFFDATTTASAISPADREAGLHRRLGVNTIWLLPFYPSPAKTTATTSPTTTTSTRSTARSPISRASVREAHRRGMRVITELVMNHTSDQHPWFQAARRAQAGRPSAISTSGATPTRNTPTRGSSSATPRRPTGPGIRWPRLTTGTAFSATSRTSISTTPRC